MYWLYDMLKHPVLIDGILVESLPEIPHFYYFLIFKSQDMHDSHLHICDLEVRMKCYHIILCNRMFDDEYLVRRFCIWLFHRNHQWLSVSLEICIVVYEILTHIEVESLTRFAYRTKLQEMFCNVFKNWIHIRNTIQSKRKNKWDYFGAISHFSYPENFVNRSHSLSSSLSFIL